jgi:hypothetical protein
VVAGSKSSNSGDGDIGSVITVHASISPRPWPAGALATARATQAESRGRLRPVPRGQIAALRLAVLSVARSRSAVVAPSAAGDQIARIA